MTDRRFLTDRYLRSLPPAPAGTRIDIRDTIVPGFRACVYDEKDSDPARRGKAERIAFVLFTRFARGIAPSRRIIGLYGAISLEEARRIAGEWRSQIARGIDPRVIEKERREAAERDRVLRIQSSFASVAEQFIIDKLVHERRGDVAARDLRSVFVAAWGERLITAITTDDVLAIINAKKRRAPQMARVLLGLVKRFFNWVIDAHVYGLTVSPCDRIKARSIIGQKRARERRLTDEELLALWRATGRMKYPVGSLYRVLLLTGLRLNEAAQLSWPEIHGDIIKIPASRMKGDREHLLPMSSAVQEIVESLPRYRGAPFLFSFSGGRRALAMNGRIKGELNARMVRTLKALARRRGDDHHAVNLTPWVTHDLRRVVRGGLSQLRVPHNVAEAVLAHHQGGVVGTYDVHLYDDEKREALEKWARHVASIVSPTTPAKVVKLRARR